MMAAALLLALGAPVPPDAAGATHSIDGQADGRGGSRIAATVGVAATVRLLPPAVLRGGVVEADRPFRRRTTTIETTPGRTQPAELVEFE